MAKKKRTSSRKVSSPYCLPDNLEASLNLYDHLQIMIAGYERHILEKIKELQPPERRELPVPEHPNAAKEKTIIKKGGQEYRTALYGSLRLFGGRQAWTSPGSTESVLKQR